MADVRPAAVAGMFYPAARAALVDEVRAYLSHAQRQENDGAASGAPKALIVPHAGYMYSGPIAASAYALLAPVRATIRRVVLFGPAHRVAVRGLALPAASAFATPLGTLAVDHQAAAAAAALPQVRVSEAVHAFEHSLEVQLPFLQTVLDDFSIVPFAVGDATGAEVRDVLDALWGGAETLVVISSDLSHYHRYGDAVKIDRATADAVLALSASLDHEQACGATPINGLLLAAGARGLRPRLLDLRNSGDTAGDKSRVVGYAAFALG